MGHQLLLLHTSCNVSRKSRLSLCDSHLGAKRTHEEREDYSRYADWARVRFWHPARNHRAQPARVLLDRKRDSKACSQRVRPCICIYIFETTHTRRHILHEVPSKALFSGHWAQDQHIPAQSILEPEHNNSVAGLCSNFYESRKNSRGKYTGKRDPVKKHTIMYTLIGFEILELIQK